LASFFELQNITSYNNLNLLDMKKDVHCAVIIWILVHNLYTDFCASISHT